MSCSPLPHGGRLVDLFLAPDTAVRLRREASTWDSWDLTPRQLCDLELLLAGGFSPLTGFLGEADYRSVCERSRLVDGTLWPIPVTLDVTGEIADRAAAGAPLVLRDPEGLPLAILRPNQVWELDIELAASSVYGTLDRAHPGVDHLYSRKNRFAVGGELEGLRPPLHYDFASLRLSPAACRAEIGRRGWSAAIAFQTRNPLHRAHFELTRRAMDEIDGGLLLHPVVGMTKPGDVDHFTRVRCYQALLPHYPDGRSLLALLPLSMRMAGPREAVWHAIIRKNYGCSHFIVGRDHAGPGVDSAGRPFYGPYDAQEAVREHEKELGIRIVPFANMVYSARTGTYLPEAEAASGEELLSLSGTELRHRLERGLEIPAWFTFPEVERELRRSYPPLESRGLTVFFTGLSGAGKSTLARALMDRLLEIGTRPVTLLDGDLVRRNLSSELGFSKEHRDLNIRRIGFVASEITKNRGIAICAPIAPYDGLRKEVRGVIEATGGGFVLIHVATPIEVCERRDAKGLYAKARAGLIPTFTGVSDPYEEPTDADLVVDTTDLSPDRAAELILANLRRKGYQPPAD